MRVGIKAYVEVRNEFLLGFRVAEAPLGSAGKLFCHGDFPNGVFGQRDPNRVADTVLEERTDPDGALDSPILGIAGFGDPEMEGIAGLPS
jgi:hypothetical protein